SKRIIVTGGAGFLGAHVIAHLRRAGCRQVFVPRSAEFDLTSEADICRLLAQQRPEVVIHLAARVGGIAANQKQPATFLYQNLMMGAQLVHQSWKAGVEKFVQVGTICSYPKFTPVPFKESDIWNGYPEETNAPYGLAKKMIIAQLQAYKQQFGFNGINLLIVNLYGPGDNFDLESSHVIPALIRKCVEARQAGTPYLPVWGTGRPTREFLYVDDAARAICLAVERHNDAEPINIGSGEEIAIADLAELIKRKTGYQGSLRFDPNRPDGQPRRCLDVTKARDLLGFTAQVRLSEGLDRTVDWYLAHQSQAPSQAA